MRLSESDIFVVNLSQQIKCKSGKNEQNHHPFITVWLATRKVSTAMSVARKVQYNCGQMCSRALKMTQNAMNRKFGRGLR